MFVLDTNVLSELRKAGDGRADRNVVDWLSGQDAGLFYLSAITVMETNLGILLIERRDAVQGKLLRQWFESHVLPEFTDRILPVDTSVAMACAVLHVPNSRPERDALIAATARVYGMSVVTRNISDFEGTGVAVINPFDPRA